MIMTVQPLAEKFYLVIYLLVDDLLPVELFLVQIQQE